MAFSYMPGFGNDFETETLPGSLPQGRNSPQRPAYGLYAEQLSGSPFTVPRGANERSWLSRIRPSVKHTGRFRNAHYPLWKTAPNLGDNELALGQYRWDPMPLPAEPTDFISGMRTMTTAGDALGQSGMAAHVYLANRSMADDHFFNADGEMGTGWSKMTSAWAVPSAPSLIGPVLRTEIWSPERTLPRTVCRSSFEGDFMGASC